jgi:hypothetical protein
MHPLIQYLGYTITASLCAFLKIFYKTNTYLSAVIIGILFAITEIFLRLPTKTLGLDILGLSVYSIQITWISANVIMSTILSVLLYGTQMTFYRLTGMMIMLFGVSIVLG